jgi:hypothetical protein
MSLGATAAPALPVNDDFVNRTPITGTNVTVTGTLASATGETGEPFLPGISSGQTAWWSWTAPTNGDLTLSVVGTNFNPLVTVYLGNTLPALALVASNNYLICYSDGDCGCHWRMRDQIMFHVTAGQQYQFDVDSPIMTDAAYPPGEGIVLITPGMSPAQTLDGLTFTTNIAPGDFVSLQLQFTAAPTNDNFANRTKLTGARTSINANNYAASDEPGEPDKMGNPGGSSIWYTWTAPSAGRVTLSTNNIPPYLAPSYYQNFAAVATEYGYFSFGVEDESFTGNYPVYGLSCGDAIDQTPPPPPYFPVLAAFTGTNLPTLTPANGVPVALAGYPYAIEFDVRKGCAYQIAVDGNMGTTSDITLYLALTPPPANSVFANSAVLHGIYIVVNGYNAGAVAQAGAPNIGNGSTGKYAWWTWTAPVSGPVTLDLTGSDFNFPVSVFTGATLNHLRSVANGAGYASFNAVAGQTYHIAIGDASGQTGAITMTLVAPVVSPPLTSVLSGAGGRNALLTYSASPGQVLLLLRSSGGSPWQDLQTATAHHHSVQFFVTPAPTPTPFSTGTHYAAVIVDLVAPASY